MHEVILIFKDQTDVLKEEKMRLQNETKQANVEINNMMKVAELIEE